MIRLLLAEDEIALAKIIKDALECQGKFMVTTAYDGPAALNAFRQAKPDILVLDVMMPRMDGFTLARTIRQMDPQVPILFLTARSSTDDLVTGFKLGGNDYLKKPFDMTELVVRVQALLRRPVTVPADERPDLYTIGRYTFRISQQTLQIGDQVESLSYRETEILRMLVEHANDVLRRQPVLIALWGDDSFFNARSMDVFITKLRKKLKADPDVRIVNIRGIGYKLIC